MDFQDGPSVPALGWTRIWNTRVKVCNPAIQKLRSTLPADSLTWIKVIIYFIYHTIIISIVNFQIPKKITIDKQFIVCYNTNK
jgi:hypothetical protein